jgi:hypothetical protein
VLKEVSSKLRIEHIKPKDPIMPQIIIIIIILKIP